jgi:uncharacterized protein with ATP-grasp and redox domains
MLENAKVIVPYKEIQSVINKAKEVEDSRKEILELEQRIESKAEVKVLDNIIDLLVDGFNSKNMDDKQACIKKSIEKYCNTFKIPIKELIPNINDKNK